MNDDDFKTKYNEAKKNLLQHTAGYLQANMEKAARSVVEIIENDEIPPQIRLNANRTILEYTLKMTESIDILSRIELLE